MDNGVNIKFFKPDNLPDYFHWQILSFIRTHWPDGFQGVNQFRDWISHKEFHPVHLVIYKDKLLISYACIVWKELNYQGQTFQTYGLSGVFTYPSFRKQGYGLKLIQEAKSYLLKQPADIVLFTSVQKGFYEKAGFIRLEKVALMIGDPKSPEKLPETVYMLFLSDKGKSAQKDFTQGSIYFGSNEW